MHQIHNIVMSRAPATNRLQLGPYVINPPSCVWSAPTSFSHENVCVTHRLLQTTHSTTSSPLLKAGQPVRIVRGTYSAQNATIMSLTCYMVYLCLTNNRIVRVKQTSMATIHSPPPAVRTTNDNSLSTVPCKICHAQPSLTTKFFLIMLFIALLTLLQLSR